MPSSAGGGSHAIIGTIEAVGLALLWSLPLGLSAAVFLNESRSRWRRPVTATRAQIQHSRHEPLLEWWHRLDSSLQDVPRNMTHQHVREGHDELN